MSNDSKFLRFLLRSPLPLIIFIIIPAALVLSSVFHVTLPFRITQRVLLFNNVGLLLILAIRVLLYLSGLRRAIRYGEAARPSVGELTRSQPATQVREDLVKSGFRWNTDSSYAEKHDRGYLGITLVYIGLFLLLFIGTWENMCQFSGTILQGVGIPSDLSKRGSYFPLMMGPLASTSGLPKLEVAKQIFPNSTYHKGATEIVLWSQQHKSLGGTTLAAAGDPYSYKGYDIYLSKLLVDVAVNISAKDNREIPLFYDSVKLSPLWKKEGEYSLYGTFKTPSGFDGEAFYNPDKKVFKFILTSDGKKVFETEYVLYQYREKVVGKYVLSLDAMGNWSEIHVVRRRHMDLLWVGGVIAFIGLIMRIVFRPQRVWLEETPEGCKVWTIGGETKKLVKGEE